MRVGSITTFTRYPIMFRWFPMASLLVSISLLLKACVWVDLNPGAQSVKVVSAGEASRCKKVGHVIAQTSTDVIGIPRDGESMNDELTRIARNQAPGLGGNAVFANGAMKDGVQHFDVMRCPLKNQK